MKKIFIYLLFIVYIPTSTMQEVQALLDHTDKIIFHEHLGSRAPYTEYQAFIKTGEIVYARSFTAKNIFKIDIRYASGELFSITYDMEEHEPKIVFNLVKSRYETLDQTICSTKSNAKQDTEKNDERFSCPPQWIECEGSDVLE